MNDSSLIRGLRDGRETAYRTLYSLYKDKVYNTAVGMVQNMHDAENIAQEVFVKIFNNIHSFREESALGSWIYRLTVNHSLDFLRRHNRVNTTDNLDESLVNTESDFQHPGIIMEQKERSAILFKALQALPGNQMTAFVLQKMEGLSMAEIANILDISVKAVESLLSRAKVNLQQYIINNYGSI